MADDKPDGELREGRSEAAWREIDERCAAGDLDWAHPDETAALDRLLRDHPVASDPFWEELGRPARRALLAFLFARKLDVERTAELLEAHLAWRAKYEVSGRVWLRDVPEATALSLSEYCFHPKGSRAKDGKVITYMFAGRYDPNLPLHEVVLYMMWLFDHTVCEEHLDSWRRGTCYIEDITGAGYSTTPKSKDKAAMGEMQNVFPILIRSILIVEPGFIIRALLAIARVFMRDKVMKRIECVKREVVLERVDPAELLPFFGGTAEYDREGHRAAVLAAEAELRGEREL